MKLYRVNFEHFAPRGSKDGLLFFTLADSDEEMAKLINKITHGLYEDLEDLIDFSTEDDSYSTETVMQRITRTRGDMNDAENDQYTPYEDAYYGVTLYGWEEVPNYTSAQVEVLLQLNLLYEDNKDEN
jgi:hypothetical protein